MHFSTLLVATVLVAVNAQNGFQNGGNSGEMFENAAQTLGLAGASNGFSQNNGQGTLRNPRLPQGRVQGVQGRVQGLRNQWSNQPFGVLNRLPQVSRGQWANQMSQAPRGGMLPSMPVSNINNAFGRQPVFPNQRVGFGSSGMGQNFGARFNNGQNGFAPVYPNRGNFQTNQGGFAQVYPNRLGMNNQFGMNTVSPNRLGLNTVAPNRLGLNNNMRQGFVPSAGRWNTAGQTNFLGGRPTGWGSSFGGNTRFNTMMGNPALRGQQQFNRFSNNANALALGAAGTSDGDWTDYGIFS